MDTDWKAHGKDFTILVTISAFIAFINPYGAAVGPDFIARWAYWGPLIVLGGVVGALLVRFALRLFPRADWRLHLAIVPPLIALVITMVLLGMYAAQGARIDVAGVLGVYIWVWVIAVAMTGFAILLGRAGVTQYNLPDAVDADDDSAASKAAEARFLKKLPMKYHAAMLLALQSEDHYLRVHTDKGEELILMRLSDAIEALADMDGMQTHRSWWVARHGVASVKKAGAKISLVLNNDAEAAVSRPNVKRLKDAGWI